MSFLGLRSKTFHIYLTLSLLLIPLSLFILIIVLSFQKNNKHNKHNKKEGFLRDSHLENNSSINDLRFKRERLTFPNFHFHAHHPGFLHIGNFLLQWGSANTDPKFVRNYSPGQIKGGFCIPNATNTGRMNLKYEGMHNDHIRNSSNLKNHRCERPILYLAYGFCPPHDHDVKITYSNRSSVYRTDWLNLFNLSIQRQRESINNNWDYDESSRLEFLRRSSLSMDPLTRTRFKRLSSALRHPHSEERIYPRRHPNDCDG